MASSSITPVMEDGDQCINWAELPYDLTSSILRRLSAVDILESAQKVCTSWRRVCKDPATWRKIDMGSIGDLEYEERHKHGKMCRHAVERSQGGLLEIDISYIGNGTRSLLSYIANRSINLRCLKISTLSISSEVLTKALWKLPLIEELGVSFCRLSGDSLKVVGQSLPNLKTLKLNSRGVGFPGDVSDDDALAIAETMHGLRHLQLIGNILTDAGLNAIFDNCLDLEHLDLRQCFNVHLSGDLDTRCSERIKVFKRPYDSTHDILYYPIVIYPCPDQS